VQRQKAKGTRENCLGVRARNGCDYGKARPAGASSSLSFVDDGVRGRDAEASPRNDRRQSRQPPREPSAEAGSNRQQQRSELNRDHQEDAAEAHEAVLRFPAWECSLAGDSGRAGKPS